ncbi:Fanconi anemia group M protein-like isoform X2 [Diaphorina citri]|uniref:Fanconi anemia group M protein-like isoform X2 n=1 Tax=Diaphorina citri TaxID=121845 RepID=A0A1S4EPT0_DIACI|nr:Fanconi anemia group M protein-like isoform X2 [Diaphorina citri]
MTDAQFEEWLKNLNEVSKEPEPVTSQYFQPKPNVINANQVLMSNRGNLKPSQKVSKTTLTRREKEDFERPRKEPSLNRQPTSILKESVNKSILDKSSSSNTSVLCISSEDDEDLYFFKTTGKPDTRNESRPKPNEPHSKPTSRNSKPSESRNPKQRKKVRKKANPYIEEEADVSVLDGQGMSSDDDLTNSSQDEMDSSFIDDEQDRDQTMGVYLKSVRSPQHSAKFKIPVLSDTVLNMDVYSQAVAPDRTEYLNDSFCVSDEECEDSNENEASLLELAEARLEMERKMKKKGRGRMEKGREGRMEKGREGGMEKGSEKVKPRRRVIQMISSSDED